ncbi:hypothetical protein TWF694_007667 [Orbilia ellipsospora]|uniref:DUF7707 domain-containing protein n=1 Tax=Orbilia ellipsospora TaxID=2528407 RepID=A0AAV9XJD5_9PEZI
MVAATSVFVTFASLAALATAQVGVGNQTVLPDSVDLNTRNGWCRSEMDTCTTLCSKNWSTNNCSAAALTYSCVCADGSKPDLVNYINTLPFFICQQYIANCVAGNATEPTLQTICRNTNTCGSMDPADFVASTTIKTTSAPTSSSGGATNTGAGGAQTTSATSSPSTSPNAAPSLEYGQAGLMRMCALVAAFGLAGFGLVL